ncbi:MAG: 3-phosphoshikimate 1-carboxyvinyltransferase [Bacteroidales bacterium]|nr:3-phosphoshikimate 1-carboxyvinyltransferase [Bacteroidales bacterium]
MIAKVYPATINGSLQAPASKSMLQRAIAAAFLSKSKIQISGYTPSADADAALALIEKLGSKVNRNQDLIEINSGDFIDPQQQLTIGESGLGIRLFSPILATFKIKFRIEAEGTLRKRPLRLIEDVLSKNGVSCSTNQGFAPIEIIGPLKGGTISLDASEGSQFLSGLLMALPISHVDSTIQVRNLKSKPYIDMTMQLLTDFGVNVQHTEYKTFSIKGNQNYRAKKYKVEGDWSGAAFLLVAGAIAGKLTLKNIHQNSLQGDKNCVKVLEQSGAIVLQKEKEIRVQKRVLHAFEYDATETPDLFPPLAALAASCEGVSIISGVNRLEHKESNRAEAIRSVLEKLGIKVKIVDDEMHIHGGKVKGAVVSSFHDHRIAMMAAVMALNSESEIEITDAESINKSYPGFYEDLQKLGVPIQFS